MLETAALVQVGSIGLRGPDGNFLPSTPVYILADAAKLRNGMTEGETQTAREFGQIVAGLQQIQNLTKN